MFPIHVPPLRQRRDDVAPLVNYFLDSLARQQRGRHSGVGEEAMAILISYHWPGNVRQLYAAVERALLLSEAAVITERHLPSDVRGGFIAPENGETATTLAYCQRLMISRALFETGWDLVQAARRLSITTHALRQMIGKFGLKRRSDAERRLSPTDTP